MKNVTTHKGILTILNRLPSSNNGNPRYEFEIDGYTARTPVDSSYGYSITNHDGKECVVTLGDHYGYLSLNSIEKSQAAKLKPINSPYIYRSLVKHLLNGVYDFEGNDKLKLAHICYRFEAEYNHADNQKRYPFLVNRIKEWLMGLPLHIHFNNYDIIEYIENLHGVILNDHQIDSAIDSWFGVLAQTLMSAASKSDEIKMTCIGFEILTSEKVSF